MLPPSTSRRVVSTIPIFSPPTKPHNRKFVLSRPNLRQPTQLFFLCLLIFLVFFDALSRFFYSCDSPKPLIPTLEKWTEQTYAKSHLAIYVYDLPSRFNEDLVNKSINDPGPIRDPRCDTNFYSAEVHIHRFLLNSWVHTRYPEKADFFYVPIYTTCDLITHQPNDVPRVGRNFGSAMQIVQNEFPYWNRSAGRDHVFMFSQGFAGRLAGDWQLYKNAIFMVHNGEFTAPEYTPRKDFTIPPELKAYLQPYWLADPDAAEHGQRKYLAQFGGQVLNTSITDHRGSNYSGGVRQYIQEHFADHPEYRITGVRSDTYLSDMKNSRFCLAPEGWHPWSPRPYYGVLMGCIPVIISEVQELAFEDIVDWDSFAVWIRPANIAQLDIILRSFSDEDIFKRRRAMKNAWRGLWYADKGLANQAILHSLYNRKYESKLERNFSSAT